MTKINHRRTNKAPVNQRYRPEEYNNGYAPDAGKQESARRTGKTDFLDKSNQGWTAATLLGDQLIRASTANDFTNGHRGMARSVKGAKKFVRTRVRFHENAATKRLAEEA